MDNQQINELTYTLVDEINKKTNEILDGLTEVNPESSTSLKNLTTSVKEDTLTLINISNNNSTNIANLKATVENTKTNIENLNNNLTTLSEENTNIYNTVLSNSEKLDSLLNGESSGSGEINNDTLTNIETSLNETNSTINTINNNVTTINSNAATTNKNVTTIKDDITELKNVVPTATNYNVIDNKLNEILYTLKKTSGEETFTEDPFKLNMPYTGKIETDRNPSNYDCYELNKEFNAKYFFVKSVLCDGTSFDFNFKITFTTTSSSTIYFSMNCSSVSKVFDAGTHTFTIDKKDVTIINNKICFYYYTSSSKITVHHMKLEVWGENIAILPRRKHFKIHNGTDKICITKVEDNAGYYLVLDNINALTPDKINKEFTLYKKGLLDYDMGFPLVKVGNNYHSIGEFHCSTEYDYSHKYSLEKINIDLILEDDAGVRYLNCETGCYNDDLMYSMHVIFNTNFKPTYYYIKNNTTFTRAKFSLQEGNASEITKIKTLNNFRKELKHGYIFTNINEMNYFVFGSEKYIEIGYGKNATAYFDKDDPLKANIYLNDGGYCVKKVVTFYEDYTNIQLVSEQIIGTYDAYFETNSDVYFVEKDKKLYMFKNGFTNNTENTTTSEENIDYTASTETE